MHFVYRFLEKHPVSMTTSMSGMEMEPQLENDVFAKKTLDNMADHGGEGDTLEDGEIFESEAEKLKVNYDELVEAVKDLRDRMEKLEVLMERNMDKSLDSFDRSKSIFKAEMESMIMKAIELGPDYGVGRGFIKAYLVHQMKIPDNQHYTKRLNNVLRVMVDDKIVGYDKNYHLYKLPK